MTGLKIENKILVKTNDALSADKNNQIVMLSPEEFDASSLCRSITVSKNKYSVFEAHPDYIFISIAVPDKSKADVFTPLKLYIINNNIIFNGSKEYTANIIDRIIKGYNSEMTLGKFIYCFLHQLIEKDMEFIEKLEKKLSDTEEIAINTNADNFNKLISIPKKTLMTFYRYYNHLTDIGENLFIEDEIFSSEYEKQLLSLFVSKTERLKSEISYLREYVLQIQEIYQTQIAARQNDIMKVLTIVTTIVLPLSLIAGWYGMNFRYMPELMWKYGYIYVIILSIVIIVISLIIFKKKKYF